LQRVDINGNGTIDYTEFIVANIELGEILTNEKLQAAFNLFDIDQNGRITIEEIKSLLGGGGIPVGSVIGGGDQSNHRDNNDMGNSNS
jgi:Ca2+-binding EF-hand superfamily protein